LEIIDDVRSGIKKQVFPDGCQILTGQNPQWFGGGLNGTTDGKQGNSIFRVDRGAALFYLQKNNAENNLTNSQKKIKLSEFFLPFLPNLPV
jgi:hypothetical protein